MKLHLLPITILPLPRETAADDQIIEDWARGLDWVKWLLGSVRARTTCLMLGGADQRMMRAWEVFADGRFRDVIGPALKSAWQLAHTGDLEGLLAADAALSAQLPPACLKRSMRAGALLLKSTRYARYQGVLGRLREAVDQELSVGHFVVVWAAVGQFFQLSLANVLAEYLHLEWDIAARERGDQTKPTGRCCIAALTSQMMHHASAESALRVVDG